MIEDAIRSLAFLAVSSPQPYPLAVQGGNWGWITQVILPIVTMILGVSLGFWAANFFPRPLLRMVGSGSSSGSGPGYSTASVTISNEPGVMRIPLGETVLFGKRVHGRVERGLPVQRNPANECIAYIHDRDTDEIITALSWRSPDDPSRATRKVNLKSGERAELMIFARLNAEPLKYFVYESTDGILMNVKNPVEEVKFHNAHRFIIRVNYSNGVQRLQLDAEVKKSYDGRLRFTIEGSGGTF